MLFSWLADNGGCIKQFEVSYFYSRFFQDLLADFFVLLQFDSVHRSHVFDERHVSCSFESKWAGLRIVADIEPFGWLGCNIEWGKVPDERSTVSQLDIESSVYVGLKKTGEKRFDKDVFLPSIGKKDLPTKSLWCVQLRNSRWPKSCIR